MRPRREYLDHRIKGSVVAIVDPPSCMRRLWRERARSRSFVGFPVYVSVSLYDMPSECIEPGAFVDVESKRKTRSERGKGLFLFVEIQVEYLNR